MEVVDNKVGVPTEHYRQKFAEQAPEAMSRASGVPYADGKFSLTLLSRPVTVSWPEMEAVYADDGASTAANIRILLARLIMEGHLTPSLGQMYAYTDMPWGNVYAQQFRGRCILRMAGSYGADLSGFAVACEALGGQKADAGDVSYDLPFLPGLTVRCILWEGDEEFAAASQILFSDNFPNAFSAEDIAVVGDIFLNAMKGRW